MGYSVEDTKGRKLCNFYPRVEKIIEVYNYNECVNMIINIRLMVDDGGDSDKTIDVQKSDINHIRWQELDERCQFEPEFTDTKIQRYLAKTIRNQLEGATRETKYQICNLGLSFIKGEAVFCTGREAIKPPSSGLPQIVIAQQLKKRGIDIDKTLSEGQAISEMFDLISLSINPGRILLMYKLVYLMRHAYVDAGAKPNFCIYLYGKTGTMKTTFSNFLTQLYNRGEGIASPPRLNASIAAVVKILSEISDDTIVLDDLCPAESNRIRKQQEETLVEITRYVGDGTMPLRVKGKELINDSPKCGVIFTGEYIIGNESDTARLLPIEMVPPDGEKLKYFQDRPLMVSTFYYYFIVWLVTHYQEVVELLKMWLDYYRKKDFGVHARLQEMHFFLCTACLVFMWYCHDKKFLSSDDVKQVHNYFLSLLNRLVQDQDKRVQQGKSEIPKVQNYLGHIRELYKNGRMSIANDVEQFNMECHDGLWHNNRLYLRGERLTAFFPSVDINEVIAQLDKQGVLETGSRSKTKQLYGLNGKRFYVFKIQALT